MKIGFAVARAAGVDHTWTTVHLAVAALEQGHVVRFVDVRDFEVDPSGRLIARAFGFEPQQQHDVRSVAEALQQRRAARSFLDVSTLDLLLLRCAPLRPSLMTFAMMAKNAGVKVVNDPSGLMMVSHKSWLAQQRGVATPATLVTRSRSAVHLFADRHRDGVVIKPARASGGRAVAWIRRGRAAQLDGAFDAATSVGDGYVVVQSYLPEAANGEKRLVWLDGEVLGGYLRRRASGEFRHNLKRGAVALPTEVTDRERAVVAMLSPRLLEVGIRFAGLDVIGEHIIEVNALNPGGSYHSDRLNGTRLAEAILWRLSQNGPRPVAEPRWAPRVP